MMATLFAPPEILSAYSYAVDGSDPDLPKGTHLRIFAGMGASFPLAPFAVFKIASSVSEPRGIHAVDRRGTPVGDIDLGQLGIAVVTPILGDSDTRRTVRVELVPDDAGGIRGAQLLDQQGRVVAERDADRYLFSAPVLHKFRVWGPGRLSSIRTQTVDIANIASGRIPLEPSAILGFPVEGAHPWYVGVDDHRAGLNRVANGAPRRLNPMDRPDGPFDAISADEEAARIEAMLSAGRLAGGLEALLSNLVDDQSAPPWLQTEETQMQPPAGGTTQFAKVPRLGNLQMAALDPGIARFLGLAERMDDLPDLESNRGWNALAVVGLFAIDPRQFDPDGPLASWLAQPAPGEALLVDMIVKAAASLAGRDIRGDVEELTALNRERGLLVRACVAVTAPTPPWLAPSLPKPQLVEQRWQTAIGDMPSVLYRAGFAFSDAPLASMAAMAAQIEGNWVSRHDQVDVPGFSPRATPRIFGKEADAFPRARLGKIKSISAHRAGLLADQDISAETDAIPYRCRASDFFGRFGEPVEFDVTPPARPGPPPPVLRFHVAKPEQIPDGDDPVSPGVVKLTFAVPQLLPAEPFAAADRDRLASAMAVPAIHERAAGSMPIAAAHVALGAETKDIDLTAPGMIDISFDLPALQPQEIQTLTLSASFTDTQGVASSAATQLVKVTDRRPPKVYPTGMGLFWTSTPGPSPDVELKLAWPAAPNSLHRVYATDQEGLGLTPAELAEAVPGAAPSRGRVAQVGGNKVLAGAPIDRRAFRLLTDKPVIAGADGRAVLATQLPRSLETVQFLRVVPLSAEGAEAPFDACGIVPVAVPESRRPTQPRLAGTIDPVTGVATLTITADGFDGVALQRDEPGLFDAGAVEAVQPSFRIRRAVGAVADPLYARALTDGQMARDAAAAGPVPVFTGTAVDDNGGRGLEPFVRYIYWADVRLPPERRLPAGVAPINPPGGITVVDPGNAADHPRPVSLPSAPRVLLHLPPDPPAAPAPENVTLSRGDPDGAGAVEVTIEIVDPPRAHPKAVGPYRLAVWTQWQDGEIAPAAAANGAPLEGVWPDLADGTVSVTVPPSSPAGDPVRPIIVRMAIVDPAGRVGGMTTMSTP